MNRLRSAPAALALALGVAPACESDVLIGAERREPVVVDSGAAGAAAAEAGPDGGAGECVRAQCLEQTFACGDCVDNDGDGLVDTDDPDCLGACQNNESGFFPNLPGQGRPGCVGDCYFDQDRGDGNDRCRGSQACDPLEPALEGCTYSPTDRECTSGQPQEPRCLEFCGPLTPNGCDCFGCCSIPGAATPVWIGSVDAEGTPTCTLATAGDPTMCRPCTQIESCVNPCENCELCVGKTALPASCGGGRDASPVCRRGDPCGLPHLPRCPPGTACITGCCTETIR